MCVRMHMCTDKNQWLYIYISLYILSGNVPLGFHWFRPSDEVLSSAHAAVDRKGAAVAANHQRRPDPIMTFLYPKCDAKPSWKIYHTQRYVYIYMCVCVCVRLCEYIYIYIIIYVYIYKLRYGLCELIMQCDSKVMWCITLCSMFACLLFAGMHVWSSLSRQNSFFQRHLNHVCVTLFWNSHLLSTPKWL